MSLIRRSMVDDVCEGCERSMVVRFPDQGAPAYCDACEDEFDRELRAGHISYGGLVFLPREVLR